MTVEYVNETVEDDVNTLAVAVTVDVTLESALLVGVPVITPFAPGRLLERVVTTSPGGRFSPLKIAVLAVNG
jgi:hypothetical protein